MAKLPKQLGEAEELDQKVYQYADAVAMLDDIRRFRRHTGWTVSAELAGQVFRFKVSPAESAVTVTFLINTKWITQNLWSVYYGGDESIDQLRRKSVERRS